MLVIFLNVSTIRNTVTAEQRKVCGIGIKLRISTMVSNVDSQVDSSKIITR